MICVLPCCPADAADLLRLLKWIKLLGPCKAHDALIVTDASVPATKAIELKALADEIFNEVRLVSNERPVAGWPNGCNSLFHAAAKYIHQNWQLDFLWLEPDAIPLKQGWLEAIAKEWKVQRCVPHAENPIPCDYMGHIYSNVDPRFASQLMSGVAVYNAHCFMDFEDRILNSCLAWDVDLAGLIRFKSRHTPLIHHLWGEHGKPPVFAETAVLGTNVMSLEQIPKETVIWHRQKNGSLIRLLRNRMFPNEKPDVKIDVVFPVCQHDINQAIHHAKWLVKLGRKWDRRAIIAFDRTCNLVAVSQLRNLLKDVFTQLDNFLYPTPPIIAWPHAPNWAWQHVAYHMSQQDRPWLWMEADACVLKRDWLDALESEYERGGKPFCGPRVKGMFHANGGMIYASDTPSLIPSAFHCTDQAWDYVCGAEMLPQLHDCSDLMTHIWTVFGEDASEVGGGQVPGGVTQSRFERWIKPTSVVVHRIKDSSLVDLLMSK